MVAHSCACSAGVQAKVTYISMHSQERCQSPSIALLLKAMLLFGRFLVLILIWGEYSHAALQLQDPAPELAAVPGSADLAISQIGRRSRLRSKGDANSNARIAPAKVEKVDVKYFVVQIAATIGFYSLAISGMYKALEAFHLGKLIKMNEAKMQRLREMKALEEIKAEVFVGQIDILKAIVERLKMLKCQASCESELYKEKINIKMDLRQQSLAMKAISKECREKCGDGGDLLPLSTTTIEIVEKKTRQDLSNNQQSAIMNQFQQLHLPPDWLDDSFTQKAQVGAGAAVGGAALYYLVIPVLLL